MSLIKLPKSVEDKIAEEEKIKEYKQIIAGLNMSDMIEYFGPRNYFGRYRYLLNNIRFDSGTMQITGIPEQEHYLPKLQPVIKIVDVQHDFFPKLSDMKCKCLTDPYKEAIHLLLDSYGY